MGIARASSPPLLHPHSFKKSILIRMVDEKKETKTGDENLVSGEEIQATVVDDGLDLDIVDEFKEDDFDEEFDDDFEEEIEGEYALEDDKYGKEFDENFGHIVDPTRKKKAPDPAVANAAKDAAIKKAKEAADKKAAKKAAKKAPEKKAVPKARKKAPRKK